MIIGEALRVVFTDLEVNSIDVQYHHGDHKELIKWVLGRDPLPKYPLVWYVTAPYTEENDYKNVVTRIIILQDTKHEYYNDERFVQTYVESIEPVWQAVRKLLEQHPHIQILGDIKSKYKIKDEPNYGLDTSGNDFTSKTKKGDESIVTDWVDGRIIELNLRIKTSCITA